MFSIHQEGRRYGVLVGATLLLALTTAIVPTAASAGGGGTTRYEYDVEGVIYKANATMFGGIDSTTARIPLDSSFIGQVKSRETATGKAVAGSGSLRIGNRGTTGKFGAAADAKFTLDPARHEAIVCEDPAFPGQPSDNTVTDCTDTLPDALAVFSGKIDGGTGDRVTVSWKVRASGGINDNAAVPIFACVEPLVFAAVKCKTENVALRTFTKQNFDLAYECAGMTTKVPPGQRYTVYSAATSIRGNLLFDRIKKP